MSLKRSFTLIELSITLVVMALLTSLVLSGKHLITISRSHEIIQTINTYRQAINNFYTSSLYSGHLPGDFINAFNTFVKENDYTSFSVTSDDLISAFNSGKSKEIALDGNANGDVDATIISFKNENSLYYSEVFGVWSHLGHAHMIDKNYSNVCADITKQNNSECIKVGYNLPVIKNCKENSAFIFYKPQNDNEFDNGLFGVLDREYDYSSHVLLMTDVSNKRILGMSKDIDKYVIGGGGAVPSDLMRRIDMKIDDGKPLTGNIFGLNGSERNNKCSNYNGNTNAVYSSSMSKTNIAYNNNSNQSCIGIIVFNEFR